MTTLKYITPAAWTQVALKDFDAFLVDHAACERKASAVGLSFVVRYPDRTALIEPMIQFAREELEHFHQVTRLVLDRGLRMTADEPDEYVNRLMKEIRNGRDQHFLDRLLVSSLIEARGCERLSLIAAQLTEPKLKFFYERLARAEDHHQDFFLEMARLFFSENEIAERLETLAAKEAEAIHSVPHRSALH